MTPLWMGAPWQGGGKTFALEVCGFFPAIIFHAFSPQFPHPKRRHAAALQITPRFANAQGVV
jgi:hypothetical protein